MAVEPQRDYLESCPLGELQNFVSAGVAPAMTALASRLLLSTQRDPEQVLALISRATGLGDATAPRLAATLAALGLMREQSWEDALDFLVMASEGGDAVAQSQLRLLACAEATDLEWSVLRARVQVDTWLHVPARTPVCERPRIRSAEGFVPPAVCKWLISYARPRLKPAQVIRRSETGAVADSVRTGSAFVIDIAQSNVVIALLQHRIARFLNQSLVCFEAPQIFLYTGGQEFKPHLDYGSGDGLVREVRRVLTFLLYLNDE